MFKHFTKRSGFGSAGIIMALALFSASAQAKLPQPIYFWSNIPEPVSGGFMPNPLVIRPSTFLLFEDGQWVLQDMRWTGWGSSVAHGTGISSSSNDIPSPAAGKRIKTWARVTLSDPGWFHGHEVYRCFDLAVPSPASLGPHPWCLAHVGSSWGLMEGAPPPPPAARPKPLQVLAAWHKIAQRARFPVYRPTQTVGLKLAGLVLNTDGCLVGGYGNPRSNKGPHFGVYEPAGTVMCGQAGVATQVATAVVNGVKVQVLVQCAAWPKCTTKDGETKGEFLLFVPESGAKHYTIQLQSMHVSLSDFLKVARSFTRVQ